MDLNHRPLVYEGNNGNNILAESSLSEDYEGDGDILPLLDDIIPAEGGLIAMLKVYLDRAAKRDATDEVMCVACVVFKPTAYKQFVRPWNRMLKGWGAKEFHAKEFYPGTGAFKRDTLEKQERFEEDSRRIPQIIAKSISRVLVVSFRPSEFMRIAPLRWKQEVGVDLHSQATQICLLINGDWLKEKHRTYESFAYFMESGDPTEAEVLKAVETMRQHDKTARHIRVASFTTVNKGLARGLEAADCVAWHWNKYYMDSERKTENTRPPRKDWMSLVDATRSKSQVIFATGEDLQYIFSLYLPQLDRIGDEIKRIPKVRHSNGRNSPCRSKSSKSHDGSGEAGQRRKAEG